MLAAKGPLLAVEVLVGRLRSAPVNGGVGHGCPPSNIAVMRKSSTLALLFVNRMRTKD
jgi:hypothetical protein